MPQSKIDACKPRETMSSIARRGSLRIILLISMPIRSRESLSLTGASRDVFPFDTSFREALFFKASFSQPWPFKASYCQRGQNPHRPTLMSCSCIASQTSSAIVRLKRLANRTQRSTRRGSSWNVSWGRSGVRATRFARSFKPRV